MDRKEKLIRIIYGLCFLMCFMPFFSPALALITGVLVSVSGLSNVKFNRYTSFLLQASIVLMGFGMNLNQVIETSKSGFIITAGSVIFVMLTGYILTRILKIDSITGLLITSGTAICGGSAIAAVSPVVKANNSQMAFSLVVVFVLNAVALLIFPSIGHFFNLSQDTFGKWAAVAIHDTSSVVGAGAIYGSEALNVATTVKLIRALWIIPLTLVISLVSPSVDGCKIKIPLFIVLFVLGILFAHFVPQWNSTYTHFTWLGNRGMVASLFLIGSGISVTDARKAGFKSFMMGLLLWIIVGSLSLWVFIQNT
jgi:uncharacterized integral membrane protein (TIGR00698 family)